jgi:hypothetical protein
MFFPSDDALRQLCNALNALRQPVKLLGDHGLVPINNHVTYDENDVPHLTKASWEVLEKELYKAKNERGEQLRTLCSELLRRRADINWYDEHPLDCFTARFLDFLAHFELRLLADGYKFDGFEILYAKQAPSVAQRADEALLKALDSCEFPEIEKIWGRLSAGRQKLSEGRYDDSLHEFRLALQDCLMAIACQKKTEQGTA